MLHFGDAIGESFSALIFCHFFNVRNFSMPSISITFNKVTPPLLDISKNLHIEFMLYLSLCLKIT